ncbi:MAG: cytochrome P450 [Deltaproteobacteria bacterium]|nr:MAG: cytochrome P450 [Deltaproteobacteria bacterium]
MTSAGVQASRPGGVLYDPLDPETQRNPFPVYRRLRDEDPVHRVASRNFWVLSRFEDVYAAARDTQAFSSARGLTFEEDEIAKLGLAPTIVMMDPPRQTALRRLVSRGFTPRRVAGLEAPIRAFVVERVERMRAAGRADFIRELAGPLPTLVVAHFLGVPEEDRPRFDAWSNAIVQANAAGRVLTNVADAVADLYRYFGGLIEARRAQRRDDMISALLDSELDGERLSDAEILGFCFVMIAGGNDTTTGLLGGAAALLTECRDQRRLLVECPERIPHAVEEFLRLTSPVQGLSRTTTREVTLRGRTIPADAKVHLLYAAANRDPREFGPTAEALDVGRRIHRHLAFGSGPHFCMGAAVARLQSRVALEELLGRLPEFAVDEAAGRYAPGPFVRRFESLPIEARA